LAGFNTISDYLVVYFFGPPMHGSFRERAMAYTWPVNKANIFEKTGPKGGP